VRPARAWTPSSGAALPRRPEWAALAHQPGEAADAHAARLRAAFPFAARPPRAPRAAAAAAPAPPPALERPAAARPDAGAALGAPALGDPERRAAKRRHVEGGVNPGAAGAAGFPRATSAGRPPSSGLAPAARSAAGLGAGGANSGAGGAERRGALNQATAGAAATMADPGRHSSRVSTGRPAGGRAPKQPLKSRARVLRAAADPGGHPEGHPAEPPGCARCRHHAVRCRPGESCNPAGAADAATAGATRAPGRGVKRQAGQV